jgi:integrase
VRDVEKADVIAAIKPHWTTKNETMVRVRNRIELVLAYAMAHGYRPDGLNPARWKGHLDAALPRPSKVNGREHFEAVAVDDMHQFVQRLRAVEGISARALEFSILTASRTGAVRMAEWPEVDLEAAVWTVPAGKMKSNREHKVPLSGRALELLQALPKIDGVTLVFPGRGGKPLSDMSLTAVMRRMGLSAVPHGFRSSFATWAAERTSTPPEVREQALAHAIPNATEAAYQRSDLFLRRREVMELWAKFIDTPTPAGNVTPLRGAA